MNEKELSENSCLDLKQEYLTNNLEEILKIIDNQKSLRPTEAEEKREYAIMMQKRRDFEKEIEARRNMKPKDRYLSSLQKKVLISDITEEMEEKEEEWGINQSEILHDNK